MGVVFIINSILLGVALAMDAFSVSMANGLAGKDMGIGRSCAIAGTYGFFQAVMPMTGWFLVNLAVSVFTYLEGAIPYIALLLLIFVGVHMIREGVGKNGETEAEGYRLGNAELFVQGIATSIDALSVGFTLASYSVYKAFAASLIIAVVTFFICMAGLAIGRRVGTVFSGKAVIGGGILLILIGLEIFFRGIFR